MIVASQFVAVVFVIGVMLILYLGFVRRDENVTFSERLIMYKYVVKEHLAKRYFHMKRKRQMEEELLRGGGD